MGAAILVASENALAVAIEHDLLVKDGEAERGVVGDFGCEIERVPFFSPIILFLRLLGLVVFCLWRKQDFFIGVLDRCGSALCQPSSSSSSSTVVGSQVHDQIRKS